ncbi:MAG: hypothetical protein KAS71_02480 [Bacteroidales bacterium]|nr:hypothetical protein [Bacteroidales bacterium]
MPKSKRQSEASTLEAYRVALENVTSQKQISMAMFKLGYDDSVIMEGKNLLEETLKKYQGKKTEYAERSAAYDYFTSLWNELEKVYSKHRKKVKVIFRNESATLEKLSVDTPAPETFVNWIQSVKGFYNELISDPELQKRVLRLRITSTEIQNSLGLIEKLEQSRANYMREKGESQDATQLKDRAFAKIDDWMMDFYAVARIALEDNPQLLEALNKTVKA